jgi:hypothetical protein
VQHLDLLDFRIGFVLELSCEQRMTHSVEHLACSTGLIVNPPRSFVAIVQVTAIALLKLRATGFVGVLSS